MEYDKESFNNLWNGNEDTVRIFDLPSTVKQHLLKISPKSDSEYQETLKNIRQKIGYKEPDVGAGV